VIPLSQAAPQANFQREDFSEYVAHLQLHMALQTRKLVPNMAQGNDQRSQLLQDTQAEIEKQVSRQIF
jgi:hypothetical protein